MIQEKCAEALKSRGGARPANNSGDAWRGGRGRNEGRGKPQLWAPALAAYYCFRWTNNGAGPPPMPLLLLLGKEREARAAWEGREGDKNEAGVTTARMLWVAGEGPSLSPLNGSGVASSVTSCRSGALLEACELRRRLVEPDMTAVLMRWPELGTDRGLTTARQRWGVAEPLRKRKWTQFDVRATRHLIFLPYHISITHFNMMVAQISYK